MRIPRHAFTLIELLVVVTIIAAVAGMILAVPRSDQREAQVRTAANELAATLRQARALAMERRAMHAVTFNIENPVGSSGRVLRNAGGHWYRIIGPRSESAANMLMPGTGAPPVYSRELSPLCGAMTWDRAWNDIPVRHLIEAVGEAWVGERQVLPPNKVRFLALNDQDNGCYRAYGDTYPPTYPRPWFGWWEAATGRLHAWGGYDPTLALIAPTTTDSEGVKHKARILGGRTISHSGFFYEGYDGPITGCVNPTDRRIYDDPSGTKLLSTSSTARFTLLAAQQPRPLINGLWQDCQFVFRPDGTVMADWMRLRHLCALDFDRTGNLVYDPTLATTTVVLPAAMPAGRIHMMELGPGDMCNRMSSGSGSAAEGASFAGRSGFHWITLGPDPGQDIDSYPDAQAAVRALMPIYRVGISPWGEVVVRRVRANLRSGEVYDTALAGADWNVKAKTDQYIRNHLLVDRQTVPTLKFPPRGRPITDVLTPEMLAGRLWWWR